MAGDGSVPLDPRRLVDTMARAETLPADVLAVFVGGSTARGWNNEWSDIDAYVVSRTPWTGSTAKSVPLDPPRLPQELLDLDGVMLDVEYWTGSQFEQVLAKLTPAEGSGSPLAGLVREEMSLLDRVTHPLVCVGDEWMAGAAAAVAASPFRRLAVTLFFDMLDMRVEDALGQLAAGDVRSAVLSTRLAYGYAVDGALARYGEIALNPKWRARRLAAAKPAELDEDAWWRVETMADYDDADPAAWVRAVCRECRRITTVVDAG